MLNPQLYQMACKELHYTPDIDLFASRNNCQLHKFVSFKQDPDAEYIDAFTLNWEELKFWAFPPFNMLLKTVKKIAADKAEGILILPLWKAQPFYSFALRMRISAGLTFFPRSDRPVLVLPGAPNKIHRMENLKLAAWRVSGRKL